jgi:peptide/nickel transport system substrate-binding protein
LLNQVDAGNYHLVSFDLFGLDPSLLNSVFATNGADNALGYSNEELDDLLVQATQEQDGFTRRSLYFQIQSIVMDDALVLPIRDYVNIVGIRGTISNLKFDAFGWYPLLYDARLN